MISSEHIITNPDYIRANNVYEFTTRTLSGKKCKLDKYDGYVCMIVNIASQNKITKMVIKDWNALHHDYYEQGLRILAFPCGQFGSEPGDAAAIAKWVAAMGIQYDVFEKVEVNGMDAHPLWKYCKYMLPHGEEKGAMVKGDFTKFITNKKGVPQERFELVPTEKVREAIESYLCTHAEEEEEPPETIDPTDTTPQDIKLMQPSFFIR